MNSKHKTLLQDAQSPENGDSARKKGFVMSNSLMSMDNDATTSTHELTHYYQQMHQGWARYFGKALYEQWYLYAIKRLYIYDMKGTNEYNAQENELR